MNNLATTSPATLAEHLGITLIAAGLMFVTVFAIIALIHANPPTE